MDDLDKINMTVVNYPTDRAASSCYVPHTRMEMTNILHRLLVRVQKELCSKADFLINK